MVVQAFVSTLVSLPAGIEHNKLNLYDIYLFSFFPLHPTFALQLNDGSRLHGHARWYFPIYLEVEDRIDVGRRYPRAMVMLIRASGREMFYQAVVK